MDENRKVWQKPELIVLVRSKPEEAVLLGCKFEDESGGPGTPIGLNYQCLDKNCTAWCVSAGLS